MASEKDNSSTSDKRKINCIICPKIINFLLKLRVSSRINKKTLPKLSSSQGFCYFCKPKTKGALFFLKTLNAFVNGFCSGRRKFFDLDKIQYIHQNQEPHESKHCSISKTSSRHT